MCWRGIRRLSAACPERAAAIAPALVLLTILLVGCADPKPLFERLPAGQTGVDFVNTITENDSLLNPFDLEYLYNGAGVGVGDFDGDGRPDLYFAGNTVDSELYLNRGDFQFEDVTDTAGVAAPDAWATGVAVVDINQDGRSDLYLSVAGPGAVETRANRLFINQGPGEDGVPRFEEQADAYGLADTGYSTQAAFFDYDRDGDLDLYLLTNALEDADKNTPRPKRGDGRAPSTDRLYRNNGDGTFTDVSAEAGIQMEGYGLGVAVSDINKDGWPDVYAANDFIPNDLLYVNNGDGTFTNKAGEWLKHQSHNGMGVDVADFNNDTRPDIAVLDMLPPGNQRRKMMLSGFSASSLRRAMEYGYQPQYVRNTLQLHNGISPEGAPTFSEIGRLAGVEATDWSWAPLFADVDNDGWKDLFVSNGYGKDVTNQDYVEYGSQVRAFGTQEANRQEQLQALRDLPTVWLDNVIFQNDGDLTFTEKTRGWGLDIESLSTGAVLADLDQDGDLDLVTNNINDEAFIFANRLREQDTTVTYLRVQLDGPPGNRRGVGAKVVLHNDGQTQYRDHNPYRGYKSTLGPTVHFGLGTARQVDSLEVVWPDGRYQLMTGVEANQTITLRHAASGPSEDDGLGSSAAPDEPPLFVEEAQPRGLVHRHNEYVVSDFEHTPLLPHKLSKGGPGLAVADVNGDGLDDVFVGADRRRERTLFLQTPSGQFERRTVPMAANRYEDRAPLFFDADGDGDPDLYVVSGGNAGPPEDPSYQDRLYLNDGTGTFRRAEDALPQMPTSGSVVTAADYDEDGDLDLFVGGHHIPRRYPLPPRSYLLRNDSEPGRVQFTDVTEEVAPALAEVGLVRDALWTDYDRDGQRDLLIAGAWMPLTLFENRDGTLVDATAAAGLEHTVGWWNSLASGDFDRDGDTDYLAGNLGKNTKFEASSAEPVRVYAKDFDQNGSVDPVITRYIEGTEYPVAPLNQLVKQIPGMDYRFSSFSSYAAATFEDVFRDGELEGAYTAAATHFASSYLENRGDSTLAVRPLPLRAQFAPVHGMASGDYNGDGHLDALLVGNAHTRGTLSGWYDAMVGLLLRGDGAGGFEAVNYAQSGFFVDGDAKALATVASASGPPLVVASQTDGPLKAFVQRRGAVRTERLRPSDQYALLTFADGTTRRHEFHYGATYLSQSARVLRLPPSVVEAVVVDRQGRRRTLKLDAATSSLTGRSDRAGQEE